MRGLESLGRARDAVTGAARVALDLGGRGVHRELGGGSTLTTPAAYVACTRSTCACAGATTSMPERPVLHVGATSLEVHARPLGAGLPG